MALARSLAPHSIRIRVFQHSRMQLSFKKILQNEEKSVKNNLLLNAHKSSRVQKKRKSRLHRRIPAGRWCRCCWCRSAGQPRPRFRPRGAAGLRSDTRATCRGRQSATVSRSLRRSAGSGSPGGVDRPPDGQEGRHHGHQHDHRRPHAHQDQHQLLLLGGFCRRGKTAEHTC